MARIPEGATHLIDALYYREGTHGLAYFYNGIEWTNAPGVELSQQNTITAATVKTNADAKERPITPRPAFLMWHDIEDQPITVIARSAKQYRITGGANRIRLARPGRYLAAGENTRVKKDRVRFA